MMSFLRWGLLAALLLSGCGVFGDDEDEGDTLEIELAPGRNLVYAWSLRTETPNGTQVAFVTDTLAARVGSLDETVGPHEDLVRLDVFSQRKPGIIVSNWYSRADNTLREVAYRNAGGPSAMPKRAGTALPSPLGSPALLQDIGQDDTIIQRQDLRVVYQYPLDAGETWLSFTDPFEQTREVLRLESVEVAAGTFECVVIQTFVPTLGEGFVWIDYVAREGLVLRVIEQSLSEVSTSSERLELISLQE